MENHSGQSLAEAQLLELHAYAKLLFLRSGRQYEDKTLYHELEGDASPNEAEDDCGSARNAPLGGNLDLDRLRRDFLDRLSETVSCAKGGSHVVASRMFYWPDKAKVFVAINSGFSRGDLLSQFLGGLCAALNGIAAAPDDQTEEQIHALRDMLLRHQSSRLNTAVAELRQVMHSFRHLLPQNASPESTAVSALPLPPDTDAVVLGFEDRLKRLATFLFSGSHPDLERHRRLVSLGHVIYRTFPAELFRALDPGGDKLRQAIGFLGRLQTSLQVLVTAARQVPGFGCLSLIPVVRPKPGKVSTACRQEWSLSQTFRALNRQLNDAEVNMLMGRPGSRGRWTKNKLLNDFSKLRSPTWEVHAEIQLVLFVLLHPEEVANGKELGYIGCSRYSCLLCSKFLCHFQALQTRGCHGKLYSHSWTIPRGDGLGQGELQMLSGAVAEVTSWMRQELVGRARSPAQKRPEVKESTIGGSSIIAIPGNGPRQSYGASEHLRRQRAESSYMRATQESHLDLVEDEDASSIGSKASTPAETGAELCAGCFDRETTRRCSHCGGGVFCGEACERMMPLSHLIKCNMRQVTSADYLYQDAVEDAIPTDPSARQDYWFDRCQSKGEESHLLGLFAGLLKYHRHYITREELHQWRSHPGGNTYLVAAIAKKFDELPEHCRGGYFPWFWGLRARFELPDSHPSVPRALCPRAQMEEMEARARKYLSPEDRHKDVGDLAPFAKMHCFRFYCLINAHAWPPPVDTGYSHWFDFGFVVCSDQHEEALLSSMYIGMLTGPDCACSFEEFWRAWEEGDLMAIFDKRYRPASSPGACMHVPPELDLLGRLQGFFLSCGGGGAERPSVWRLRHFLELQGVSVESATCETARGARDYGFSEQLDTRTTMELRGFYAQLLTKVNPLTVHHERMEGNLLSFARGHIDVTPRVEAVLQSLL